MDLILAVLVGLDVLIVLYAVLLLAIPLCFGGPFVPTRPERVRRMVDLARPRPGELWLDLGAGDGRVVIAAARAGARAVGYEVNPLLVLWSRLMIRRHGLAGRAEVRWANIWNLDLSEADVVSMYLVGFAMRRMRRKLEAESKPGSRIVVNSFALPDAEPAAQETGILLYVAPLGPS